MKRVIAGVLLLLLAFSGCGKEIGQEVARGRGAVQGFLLRPAFSRAYAGLL